MVLDNKKYLKNSGFYLTVVIVNYKTASMVIDCLETLLPELNADNSCVALVDNNSQDDSIEIIGQWLLNNDKNSLVNLIKSETNSGFSSGNNIGIGFVKSKYYLLLNSDTLIREGAIKQLLITADNNRKVGVITPRLEWPDSTPQISCFNYLSPLSEFISSSKTAFITKLLNNYNVPIPVTDKITYPKWSSFACVLIKKEVLDDIGLMDDGYFMYFEDAEYCYRASKAGWKILNDPSASVVHLRGGSSPVKENAKLKKRLPRYYYESRTRYFYQMYGWLGLVMANFLWSLGRLISKMRQLFGRGDKAVSQKQWRDIWANYFNPLKKHTHSSTNKRK